MWRNVVLAGTAILGVGLYGCRPHAHPANIAVIERTGGTGFWNVFAGTAHQRAERYGFHVSWTDPQSAADYELQAQLLNEAVQRRVDGIILAPSHQLVLAEGVHRAHAAGIPVVIVDGPIAVPPGEYVTSIGCGDDTIGFLAAQQFMHTVPMVSRILVVGASPTLEQTAQRQEAFRRALQRFQPGKMTIVASRYSLSDYGRARQVTLDALKEIPDLDAIFASDEFSTTGVLSALRMAGPARRLTVVGVDNGLDALEAVRNGTLSMTIACDPTTVAELAMDAMHAALLKLPVEKLIQTEAVPLTKENVDSPIARRMMQPPARDSSLGEGSNLKVAP